MTVSLLRCAVCSVCRNTRRLGLQTTQAYLVITLLKARLLIVGMSAPWEFAKYPSDNWELPTILAWWRRLHFSCHRWRWGGQTGSEKWTSCHATTSLWGTTPYLVRGLLRTAFSLMSWCQRRQPRGNNPMLVLSQPPLLGFVSTPTSQNSIVQAPLVWGCRDDSVAKAFAVQVWGIDFESPKTI